MATLKIELRTHATGKDGKYPIYLRLGKDRQKKYYFLGLYATKEQWNDEFSLFIKDKRLNPNHITDNAIINAELQKGLDIIDEFKKKRINFTTNQFDEAYRGYIKRGNVKDFWMNLIKNLDDTAHYGNARCYEATLKMLEIFDKKFQERVFSEIDLNYVKNFDKFLQTPRESIHRLKNGDVKKVKRSGCSGNTRRYYFKALRAVLNKAIEAKEAGMETYPFGKFGFEVAKLEEETEKRYLPTDYLIKLKEHKSANGLNEYARNLFLFSYYCYGMSFIDMALLDKNKSIIRLEKGNYIVEVI